MEEIEGEEFYLMTEEMANELVNNFKKLSETVCFHYEEINSYTRIILEYSKKISEKEVEFYNQKLETSCFITRWWYKRKLQKAKDGLDAINLTIKEHNANRRSNQSPA